jgi:hypothetical protein
MAEDRGQRAEGIWEKQRADKDGIKDSLELLVILLLRCSQLIHQRIPAYLP